MAFCFAYWPKRREMVSRVPYKGGPLDTVFKDCIESSEVFTLLQHKPLVNPDKLRDPVKFIQLRSLGILKTKTQQETLKSNKN